MKRAEVLEAYKVNEYGIIQSPGKFEAEMLYVPHFYEVASDGSTDTIYFGEDERIDIVPIDAEDATEFPELTGDVGKFAAIEESDQGFVSCEIITAERLAQLEAEAEAYAEEFPEESE